MVQTKYSFWPNAANEEYYVVKLKKEPRCMQYITIILTLFIKFLDTNLVRCSSDSIVKII